MVEAFSLKLLLILALAIAALAVAVYERSVSKKISSIEEDLNELEGSREEAFKNCWQCAQLISELMGFQARLLLVNDDEFRRENLADIYAKLHSITRHGYDMPKDVRDKWFQLAKEDTHDQIFVISLKNALDTLRISLDEDLAEVLASGNVIKDCQKGLSSKRQISDQCFVGLQIITVCLVVITSLDKF